MAPEPPCPRTLMALAQGRRKQQLSLIDSIQRDIQVLDADTSKDGWQKTSLRRYMTTSLKPHLNSACAAKEVLPLSHFSLPSTMSYSAEVVR